MRTIKLTLEYDGTAYAGWQSQKNGAAIQDLVAAAVEKMTEEKIVLRGASRTDAGVHALGQAAVFKTARKIACDGFLLGLNTLLPEDIRVVGCEEVAADFHPIRHAKQKHYDYLLDLGKISSALWRKRAWWVGPSLDVAAMEMAAKFLIGEHDFQSFRGALSETKTTVRRLKSIVMVRPKAESIQMSSGWIRFAHHDILSIRFSGDGFLKYMVRNIVGTLVEVGKGRWRPADVDKILNARDRNQAGPTAPPHGLYLVRIEYGMSS